MKEKSWIFVRMMASSGYSVRNELGVIHCIADLIDACLYGYFNYSLPADNNYRSRKLSEKYII